MRPAWGFLQRSELAGADGHPSVSAADCGAEVGGEVARAVPGL